MSRFNCILCKYKNDEDACLNSIRNTDYCPSLSNIFYGKIIKVPIIKQIYNYYKKITYFFDERHMKRYWISYNETEDMKLIWGILSYDDLSGSETANFHTMNDLDLIYHKDENKYSISIETIYDFEEERYKEEYLRECLDKFTKFMEASGHDINKQISWYDVFSSGMNINTHFITIEECYAMFRLLVNGYCN